MSQEEEPSIMSFPFEWHGQRAKMNLRPKAFTASLDQHKDAGLPLLALAGRQGTSKTISTSPGTVLILGSCFVRR